MNKRLIIAGSLVLAGWCAGRAQEHLAFHAMPLKQIVLIYDHRQVIEGQLLDVVRVNREATVALGLAPLDAQAPLPPDSYMLCTMFSEMAGVPIPEKDLPEQGQVLYGSLHTNIGFKCSGRKYEFQKMDIQ